MHTRTHYTQNILRGISIIACSLCALFLWAPVSHAALTMQVTSEHFPAQGETSSCSLPTNQGTVTYTLSKIQGNAYYLGTPITALPGSTLTFEGTVSHMGCGEGGVTHTVHGVTEGVTLDEGEHTPFATSFTVPETPGLYTFNIVVWAVTGPGNYATTNVSLFYRVAYPPRLLICPGGIQTIAQHATRNYESRYWNALEQVPDCSIDTYTEVVTHASGWGSDHQTIVTVSDTDERGVATGVQAGNTILRATYAGLSASRAVTVTASTPEPIPGICGASVHTCSAGTPHIEADSADEYHWTCVGVSGGNDAPCSAPKPPTTLPSLQVCIHGVSVAVHSGTVERTLNPGSHEDVHVYYDTVVDCAGTDISATSMSDTQIPADVVSLTHGSPTRVTAHTGVTGVERVQVHHAGNVIILRYGVVSPPTPACIGSFPHASLCPLDATDLSVDTVSTLVPSCTPITKCEYYCMSPYEYAGGVCVLTGGGTFKPQ